MSAILESRRSTGKPLRQSNSTVLVVGMLVFIGFFLLSLRTLGSFTQDESQFHYPNLLNYVENGWAATFNDRYSAANTPLPYLIVAAAARLFGPSLLLARVVTVVVSFLTFVAAAKLLAREGAPVWSVFSIVFLPYFFASSFVFYAVNYGLLFLVLALLVLQRMPSTWPRDLCAGALLTAAVLCQQFYLVVPFAVLVHRGWEVLREHRKTGSALSAGLIRTALSSVALLGPLLIPLALFVAWGGLTHRNFRVHAIAFSPTNITGGLLVVGFYFLPYLMQVRGSITRWHWLSATIVSAALVRWVRPAYSDLQGPGLFTGIVFHLIHIVQAGQPALGLLVMGLLALAGCLVLASVCSALRGPFDRLLFCILAFLTVPFWMSTEIGERHLLGLVVILFLLTLPTLRASRVALSNVYVAAVGLGYFVYWMFFKFG